MTTSGNFLTTDVYKELDLTTRDNKKKVTVVLGRLVEEGLIERFGDRRGSYRLVDCDCDKINWENASDDTLNVKYPFSIESYVETMPGNIIVIAGEQNAGKTAFLLNFVKLNMIDFEIHYFSSEMGAPEMKKRLSKFDHPLNKWNFTAWERSSIFADVIRPDAVNIIDFLEIHDEFYKAGGYLKQIHDRLKTGICIVAIQKNQNTDHGLGGERTLEKPRLYLAMKQGTIKIVKAKNWRLDDVNPNGLEIDFKIVKGCRFMPDENGWHHPINY